MQNLICVGGIPYNGKTTLCQRLVLRAPSKYLHLEFDDICQYLATDRRIYAGFVDKHRHGIAKQIRRLQAKGLMPPGEEGGTLHLLTSLFAAADYMQHENCDTVLFDSAMFNRGTREIYYDTLREGLGSAADLDSIRKLFVYFDLGLEASLQQYRARKARKRPIELTAEAMEEWIRQAHGTQEIPTQDEWPNLDVHVINRKEDIEPAIERISAGAYGRGRIII